MNDLVIILTKRNIDQELDFYDLVICFQSECKRTGKRSEETCI